MIIAVGLVVAAMAIIGVLALFSLAADRRTVVQVPPLGEFIDIEGARIHCVDRGRGPPIVMVHGLGGQLRNFSYALLDKLVNRYRVILIDRPGSGHSRRAPGAESSLASHAALVAAVISRLKLERPLVMGHSLGGAIALRLALDHPDSVGALALIAPLTNVQSKIPAAFSSLFIRSGWMRFAIANTIATPLAILFGEQGRAMVFAPERVPDDFAVRGGGLLVRRPRVFASASADITDINEQIAAMMPRYSSLRLPVDMLFGREDAILDPAVNGESLAAMLPTLRLALCEGGHMLPITQPQLVSDWLDSVHAREPHTFD
jgi:pimeloyl-ACP methyl ester carboxylesterase